jgi:hypothetical protein
MRSIRLTDVVSVVAVRALNRFTRMPHPPFLRHLTGPVAPCATAQNFVVRALSRYLTMTKTPDDVAPISGEPVSPGPQSGEPLVADGLQDSHQDGDDTDWLRFSQRIALAVYGTLMVLGVLEATSFEQPSLEIHVVIFTVLTTSLAIVLAHAWATVMSDRLVFKHRLTSASFFEELRFAAAFLIPTVIALLVFGVAAAFLPVDTGLLIAEGALLLLLFVFGFGGAWRSGSSLPRCLLIGLLDVAVGVLIVGLKEFHTFVTH